MKNIILFFILVMLLGVSYYLSEKTSSKVLNLDGVQRIRAKDYLLVKDKGWQLDGKALDEDFSKIYLKILESLYFVREADYMQKTHASIEIIFKDRKNQLSIGDKAFSDHGFYLKYNDKWYLAKSEYTHDLLYKDDNDLARKQYLMVLNLFKFNKNQIRLETP